MSNEEILTKEGQNLWEYLLSEAEKKSKFKTLNEIKQLKSGKLLAKRNPQELQKIYKKYENYYRKLAQEVEDSPEKIIVDSSDSFENKLEDYVLFRSNYEGELTPKQFERLTKGWKKDRDKHSMDEWYEIYLKKINTNPGNYIEYDPSEHQVKYYAFKSQKKINKLQESNLNLEVSNRQDEPNQVFPVEENKKYFLHKVADPDTYFIDLMFEYQFCYLISINANTRYVYATLINHKVGTKGVSTKNIKNTASIIRAFSNLLQQGWSPKLLIGDAEPAFGDSKTKEFMMKYGCKIQTVERMKKTVYPDFMPSKQSTKTEPLHSSLGIIDRVIRTLRDMAYTARVEKITPEVLKDLVIQYNHAPHDTLSKYSGMDCSPEMAQKDKDLESHICRRILQENYNIMNKPGYQIEDFEYVKVYNGKDPFQKRRSIIQPGLWFINGYEEGKYHVVNAETGEDQFLPRYRIHPE